MPLSLPSSRLILLSRQLYNRQALQGSSFATFSRAMAQEYKLKDISSLNLKDGDKKTYEVEGVEKGKVLLTAFGGKVHATSPNCTHFGAPLANGVLSSDGRIRCPWHGACFNIGTGDVEDAPALDPIAKFEVFEKDGGVYIKGDEATIKASRRTPNHKCSVQGSESIVVVGGGSATIGLLQSLRENGYKGAITLIHKEDYLPIDRTKLSKALINDPNKVQLRPKEWFKDASITEVQDEVTSVDFKGKSVKTQSGKEYPYSKLVLASGGQPRSLPLPGFKELGNIHLLRTITDVQGILKSVGDAKGKKIVVVGTSFIGMEVGKALVGQEQNVTLVGMESTPLERIMGSEVGQIFQKALEDMGVKFHMNAGVEKATPSSSDSSKVGAVHLKDGTVLEADLVVVGAGIAPATQYLKESGVQLEKDGSIKVDRTFAVEGQSDVFAIGDIATFPYDGPTGNGTYTRIEHWNVAQNQGRSLGHIISKPTSKPKTYIPIFWSALHSQLRYAGNTANGWDSLVLKGDPKNSKFAAYYAKGDEIAAVATMGMDPIMVQVVELMMAGKMLSKSELDAGKDPLSITI